MTKTPLIGITTHFDLESQRMWISSPYPQAVLKGGGVPVIIPLELKEAQIERLLEGLDGVLFSGGPDIMPHLFGQRVHPQNGAQCPQRDEVELLLARKAVETETPVLGICRGIQILNVALGGDIYQDIETQAPIDRPVLHDQSGKLTGAYPFHSVRVEKGGFLFEAAGGEELMVNSFHHQAVKGLAPSLRATAWAEDGMVEALEGTGEAFVMGVQWHPELMHSRDEASMRLFRLFVEQCAGIPLKSRPGNGE